MERVSVMRRVYRARMKRMNRPARMLRIEGLMMRRKGALGTTGVVGLIMAALKDLTTGARKMALLVMVSDEGLTVLQGVGDQDVKMIEPFDVMYRRMKNDVLNE